MILNRGLPYGPHHMDHMIWNAVSRYPQTFFLHMIEKCPGHRFLSHVFRFRPMSGILTPVRLTLIALNPNCV